MFCMATSAADVDVGDGANDNTYTDSTTYAGATKIVKTGTGKTTLSFGNNTPSFNKEIEVREGTLAVARYPQNFGSPTKITVSSGATLDLTWSENALGKLNKAEIVIAGTGVNDAGAIRRTSGYTLNALFGTITLAADALIKHTPQCGFSDNVGIVNLNGHTLSVHAGSSVFYCPGTQFKDNGAATSGGLTILSGTFFPRFSVSENTEDNVLTLKDGTTLRFRDLSSMPKWKIVTEGTVTFTADSTGNLPAAPKTWVGPVEQGGQITLYPNALNTFFTIAGNISNNCDIVMDTASNSDVSGARIVGTYAEQSTAFFHKGASGAVSAADLNGKTVGLQGGSVSQKALGDSGLTMTQKSLDSLNDCFDALAAGSVDYVLCDAYAGAYLARMYNGLAFAGTIDVPQTAGVAVASTNSSLLKALGEAMGAAQMGGCLDIVRSHWIGDLPVLTAAEQVKDVPKSVSAATADDSSGGGLTVGGNAAAPPA